jgi:hypothetical protein
MKIRAIASCAALIAGSVLALSDPTPARATVYDINVDACTGGCGLSNYGTITVTGTSSSLNIDVELLTTPANLFLHQSQGSSASPGIYFNLAGTGISFSGVSANDNTGTPGWTWTSAGPVAVSNPPPHGFELDHLGLGNYAVECYSTVSGNTCGKSLSFTVTGTDLSLLSLVGGSHGTLFFGLDVSNILANGTTNTGPVGAQVCLPGSLDCPGHSGGEVPLPGALLLMGTVLAGATGVGGWRRRKRNSSAFVAG